MESSTKKELKKLYNSSIAIKKDFPKYFSKILKKHNVSFSSMGMNDEYITMCQDLIFGIDDVSMDKNKKTNINKNKNLIKTTLWNKIIIDNISGMAVLHELVVLLEEFTNHISNTFGDMFETISHDTTIDENEKTEYHNIVNLFWSYSWDTTHIRGDATSLKALLSDVMDNNFKITVSKKDSLKRYYFNYVYDLKNNIKVFDDDKMLFGNTNQIMKKYNEIITFIFSDFVAIYQSILVILEHITAKF